MANKPNRTPLEWQEQEFLVRWLTIKRIPFFMVGNENLWSGVIRQILIASMGRRKGLPLAIRIVSSIARKQRAMGLVKGAPDLVILLPKGKTLLVELKRKRGGSQTDEQKRFQMIAEKNGHIYILSRGAKQVIEYIERI